MEKPLVDKVYTLKKFPGKGGWTYAEIPEIPPDKNTYFNWVRVRGSIDDFEIKQYNLQPIGNGHLFLPVRAEIRKKIRKKAGDQVHIILYKDNTEVEVPAEIMECFENEPKESLERFKSLPEGQKKAFVDWIYKAKTEDTKAQRILEMMDKMALGLNFHDKL